MKVEVWMNAVLSLSPDSSELVRQRVLKSLQELGQTKRKRVLQFLHKFLTEHPNLPLLQRATILKSITLIVNNNVGHLSRPLFKKLIVIALVEISKISINDAHRETASKLLLALGSSFPNEVFMELQAMIQQQTPNRFYAILTLANLCSENVPAVVPLLQPVLESILNLLHMEKCRRTQWVICYALGYMSRSILTYTSNPNLPMRKMYVRELSSAYDILFHSWLNSSDPKISIEVVKAIGQIVYLLPSDKIENELPNLIPAVLSLYQKSSSDIALTKVLCGILHTALERNSKMLLPQFETLCITLHQQICVTMDRTPNSLSESLQAKILCCFQILTSAFAEEIIRFLLPQLEIPSEQIQLGTLAVLKHLISSVPSHMDRHKSQIMNSMRLSVLRNSNQVKGFLSKLIYTMASHNYLELEGGVELIRFIIEQCALPTKEDMRCLKPRQSKKGYNDTVTDRELMKIYERLLGKLTTTLTIDNVLWPLLLEFVLPAKYTNALAAVCSSLAYLGSKKQQAEETEFVLNYEEHTNLPNRQALLIRLLAVSSSPYEGGHPGAPALSLLWVLGINIHPAAVRVWDDELPDLVRYLQEMSEDDLLQCHWEQKLLQVLSQTLEEIEDEVWIIQLSEVVTKQIHRCQCSPQQKGFLFKCLGIVLQLTQSHEVVRKKLQVMLQIVEHDKDLEREGVATGIGYCAQTHLDITLATLKNCLKLNIFKKTASFYQIMKDQGSLEIMNVKSTLILCYGYLIRHCPKEIILPRIETDILPNILNHFNIKLLGMKIHVKDSTMKLSLITAITLIARAFQHIEGEPAYKMTRKMELLAYMQEFIKAEPADSMTTYVRKTAMDACTCLLMVEPFSVLIRHGDLIKLCLKSIFSLPPLEGSESRDKNKRQEIYKEALVSLEDLLKQLLHLDLSPNGLQYLFKFLIVWIGSRKNHERENSLMITLHLLTYYLDRGVVNDEVPSQNFVAIIGSIVVRCSDPSVTVREMAIDCLYILLRLQLQFEGFYMDHKYNEVEQLKTIKDGLKDNNFESLYQVYIDLGTVLSNCVPHDQVNTLLLTISEGLTDEQLNNSFVASIVINVLIRKCGTVLTDIPGIIKVLHRQLQLITQPQIAHFVTYSISILASQNVPMVLPHLLKYQIPFQTHLVDIWRSLLSDNELAVTSIKYLLNNLKLMYDDSSESLLQEMVLTMHQPLAVVHALHAMICCPGAKQVINILFPQLFCVILLYFSSSVQFCPRNFLRIPKQKKSFPSSDESAATDICNYAVEILQTILTSIKCDNAYISAANGWDLMKSPGRHHEGVMLLASTMSACAAPHLIAIVELLIPFLANIQERQRIAAVAFFAELLNHEVVLDLSLADTLVGSLLRCVIDTSPTIQGLAIRGLGNAATGAAQNIAKYSSKLLSVFTAVIHKYWKSNHPMAIEAMSSIFKVLDSRQEHFEDSVLIDVALTIEPVLENEHEKMRASAFKVLGKLVQFGSGEGNPVLAEHLHPTLISSLLHLSDESPEVVGACRSALKLMGPITGSGTLSEIFQGLSLEASTLDYEAFLSKVSRHIGEDLPDRTVCYVLSCTAFFANARPAIRGNAVTLMGFLMYHAAAGFALQFTADSACKKVCALLSDPERSVRFKAAVAIRQLYMY